MLVVLKLLCIRLMLVLLESGTEMILTLEWDKPLAEMSSNGVKKTCQLSTGIWILTINKIVATTAVSQNGAGATERPTRACLAFESTPPLGRGVLLEEKEKYNW